MQKRRLWTTGHLILRKLKASPQAPRCFELSSGKPSAHSGQWKERSIENRASRVVLDAANENGNPVYPLCQNLFNLFTLTMLIIIGICGIIGTIVRTGTL